MSSKAGIVAAAFSAHLGIPIKSEEEAAKALPIKQVHNDCLSSLSQIDLFNYTNIHQSNNGRRYAVKLFGQEQRIESDVDPDSTVANIMEALVAKNKITSNSRQDIVLQYGGRKLDFDKSPRQQNVPLGSKLTLSGSYWYGNGPHPVYYIKNEDLEPTKDYDFTKMPKTSKCQRGGYEYERPFGWDRCALKVKGKYENDIWLGEDGWREHSTPGEWAVSYHGTKMANIGSIADKGYKSSKSKRQKFGPGIYSTPSVKVAGNYATEFTYKDKKYQMLLQNRVNLLESTEIPASQNGTDASYFVTADENNIRPYGVCLKSASPDNNVWSYRGWALDLGRIALSNALRIVGF